MQQSARRLRGSGVSWYGQAVLALMLGWGQAALSISAAVVAQETTNAKPTPGPKREIRGQVRDPQGRPVAGATVTWSEDKNRVETATDDQGTFRLSDLCDGAAFLFVRKETYRFSGQRLTTDRAAEADIRLEPLSEPPSARFQPVPRAVRLEQRQALALKFIQELLDSVKDDPTRMRALESLARIDPRAAMARLEERPPREPMMAEMVRRQAIVTLAPRDAEAALEIVQTSDAGVSRSLNLIEVTRLLTASERPRKLELLAEALLQARSIKEPDHRVVGVGLVAEQLLDLGERERGEKLLRDDIETARKLGTAAFAGYARGAFAEELGQVDLPAALDLIKGLTEDFNRHHGNLAQELAGRQPEDAERVLNLLKPPSQNQFNQRDQYAVRVCYRMATVDLPRAERIASSIDDLCQRGYALGVIAAALTPKDQTHSRDLLRRAYDVLEQADRVRSQRVEEQRKGPYHPATIAGSLLAFVAQAEAADERRPLLQECVWRTVALVPSATSDPAKSFYSIEAATTVALWLADIDAPLALQVLSRVDPQSAVHSRSFIPAVAVLADDRLEKILADRLDDRSRNAARLTAVGYLTLSGEPLRRSIHRTAGLWPIDVEDLFW